MAGMLPSKHADSLDCNLGLNNSTSLTFRLENHDFAGFELIRRLLSFANRKIIGVKNEGTGGYSVQSQSLNHIT